MKQENLIEMANKLMERVKKDKENFIKNNGLLVVPSRNEVNEKLQKKGKKMETKKYTYKINFNNNYLQEVPWENVLVETDKAVLIDTTLSGHIWVNKKHCYKSKRYQFKPVFLIKVFNEMTYNIETYGDPDEPASIKGAHIKW